MNFVEEIKKIRLNFSQQKFSNWNLSNSSEKTDYVLWEKGMEDFLSNNSKILEENINKL